MEEKKPAESPPPYEKHEATTTASSSSKRPHVAAQPVTYTLTYTAKAARSFSLDLPQRLVAAHKGFDPSTRGSSIRVITHLLANSYGNWFYDGGVGAEQGDFRYVRVVVEMPLRDGMTAEAKQELMVRIVSAVQAYEGAKKARETEVDVVIREIMAEDEMWVSREIAS